MVGVHYAGATYAHKLRPVDVLEQILRESRGGKLEQFFALYGAPEASAMCYFLSTAKDKNEVEPSSTSLVERRHISIICWVSLHEQHPASITTSVNITTMSIIH